MDELNQSDLGGGIRAVTLRGEDESDMGLFDGDSMSMQSQREWSTEVGLVA